MSKKIWSILEYYITKKIGAEIKCCLTFLLILTYYCIYRWVCGFTEAGIIHMLEMVMFAYVMEWIQVLMHSDFDEVECLGMKEWALILIGSMIYGGAGNFCGWFDGSIVVCIGFGAYMVCVYLSTFLVYKIKRVIDAKVLNNDLKQFHERRLQEEK